MLSFNAGERVCFDRSDGSGTVYAVVLRRNTKTVSLLTEEGDRWNVSPGMLRKVAADEGSEIHVRDAAEEAPLLESMLRGENKCEDDGAPEAGKKKVRPVKVRKKKRRR